MKALNKMALKKVYYGHQLLSSFLYNVTVSDCSKVDKCGEILFGWLQLHEGSTIAEMHNTFNFFIQPIQDPTSEQRDLYCS